MEESNFRTERQCILIEISSLEKRLEVEGYSGWLKSQIESLEERLHIIELDMYAIAMGTKARNKARKSASTNPVATEPIQTPQSHTLIQDSEPTLETQRIIITFGAIGQRSLDLS